ncbi:MAG: hypothetical protein ACXWDO_06060 [Bacteroidia bacterium]
MRYQQRQQQQRPMNSKQALQHIETALKRDLPNYKFSQKENEKGRYLLVEQSGLVGLGIWYNNGKMNIESVIPSEKLNKYFGKATKFFHVFKRNKRMDFVDEVVAALKKVTK